MFSSRRCLAWKLEEITDGATEGRVVWQGWRNTGAAAAQKGLRDEMLTGHPVGQVQWGVRRSSHSSREATTSKINGFVKRVGRQILKMPSLHFGAINTI